MAFGRPFAQFFGPGSRALRTPINLAGRGVGDDVDEPTVAMQQRNLVDQFVAIAAEFGRQRLGLELGRRRLQRGERLEQATGLDFFAGFARRQAAVLERDANLRLAGAGEADANDEKRQGEDGRRHTQHVAVFPHAPE